jgi:hypothetical protein
MKKYNSKHRQHLLTKSKKTIKINRKRKDKTISLTNQNLNKKLSNKSTSPSTPILIAPKKFNLKIENCEHVLDFINDLKNVKKYTSIINVNLKDVVEIGEGAIVMLLSVIQELNENGVRVIGDKPKDKFCNATLEKSGFFRFVKTQISNENLLSKNSILRTGHENSFNSELAIEIEKSMETIWGIKSRCPLLYGGVYEMIRNSCDHAFSLKSKITWHFAINHNDSIKSVKYAFVDNGKGIIKSYTSGLWKNIVGVFKNNAEFLKEAFNQGIDSRTKLPWRGKGLPFIYELFEDGVIKNLVVISNNVYLDFENKIYRVLDKNYKGTYYYWEIDENCVKSNFI